MDMFPDEPTHLRRMLHVFWLCQQSPCQCSLNFFQSHFDVNVPLPMFSLEILFVNFRSVDPMEDQIMHLIA